MRRRATTFPVVLALAFSLLLSLAPAWAGIDGQVREMVRAQARDAKVGLMMLDVDTGEVLAQLNADEPLMPASNMKLITTAAALKFLGPGFKFQTQLRMVAPADWAATGDARAAAEAPGLPVLVIQGDGDPSLGDNAVLAQYGSGVNDVEALLQFWSRTVQATGIKRFAKLIVDDRVFDRQFVHPTWPTDQLHNWWCAQVAGVNFYTNCIDVVAQPTRVGQSPRIKLYPIAPFFSTVNMAVTSTGENTFGTWRKPGTNELTHKGKIKSMRREEVTVHDPPEFLGRLLADRLAEAGVAVDAVDRPTYEQVIPRGRVLHIVETHLAPVLDRCNKDSQNLYAEALLKRVGRQVTGAPGGWDNGAAAVRIMLQKMLGTPASVVSVADGSGLSRDNKVTARVLASVLRNMHQDPALGPLFRQSLSVAGKDGTLEKRLSDGVTGQVYGKSGYIREVSTLSGFVLYTDDQGQPRTAAFSLLFNDVRDVASVRRLQDRLVRVLDKEMAEQVEPAVKIGG